MMVCARLMLRIGSFTETQMAARTLTPGAGFGAQLRSWRECRKLSQLELALASEVSQRHISWLENERSRPSRTMIGRLADALQIPLRERNTLLVTAGFAAVYARQSLQADGMAPVQDALTRILNNHEPYPAIVADRYWNIAQANDAMERLLARNDPAQLWQRIGDDGRRNLALLTLHPDGLRPFIDNWAELAPPFLRRLRHEALERGDPEQLKHVQHLEQLANLRELDAIEPQVPLLPVLPLKLTLGPLRLSMFSVISTFGTPQDVTTDELRIESFFPADDATEQFFCAAAASA